MNELKLTEEANKALVLSNNNPNADRRACNFAVNTMFRIQEKERVVLSSPARILWKITGQCNSNCLHCWASLGNKHSREELLRVAHEIADLNVMMVSISGGEPFMCENLFEVIDILKSKNIIVEIMSNGSLIDENVAEKLSRVLDLNIDAVQISLDGSTEMIHDKQRNSKIFDAVVDGIRYLRKYNIPVRAAFCATSINQYDIFNTYMLANLLDVQTFSVVPVFRFRKAELFEEDINSYDYLLEIVKCKNFENETTTQLRLHANQFFQYLLNKHYDNLQLDSLFGKLQNDNYVIYPNETNSSIQIDAQGDVVPGPEWDKNFSGGNVYKENIKDIWERGLTWKEFRSGRDLSKTKCARCRIFPICLGGNMKYAYEKYGTINMPDGTCLI